VIGATDDPGSCDSADGAVVAVGADAEGDNAGFGGGGIADDENENNGDENSDEDESDAGELTFASFLLCVFATVDGSGADAIRFDDSAKLAVAVAESP
jgi:hypothetical protein